MKQTTQGTLFPIEPPECRNPSTFVDNMRLPIHRWFRYSAGFSAQWAENVIRSRHASKVLDPFAGSATTLLAAQNCGVESCGIEAHPFVYRVGRAKLARNSDPDEYRSFANAVLQSARKRKGTIENYPELVRKCYRDEVLADLDKLRRAFAAKQDDSIASELTWLTLVSILRRTSHVGTANWQYVLPRKSKKKVSQPFAAFDEQILTFYTDMLASPASLPKAELQATDARTCSGLPSGTFDLVITSPPYPNNYDYADATRLEMCFMGEINGWGDLQDAVRRYLVRSCSQHVTERSVDLETTLAALETEPIGDEIKAVCNELAQVRLTKGGRKNYHLMIACYFLDMAETWKSLRRVCTTPSNICFVIGDSAPYGVYVPVMDWMGRLAINAGFTSFEFEKIRDRNVKWKNRKHRVPLAEGNLWVLG